MKVNVVKKIKEISRSKQIPLQQVIPDKTKNKKRKRNKNFRQILDKYL